MPALRIRVFGGLSVENHGTPLGPATQQPKRLALLALIASAGRQGISRDQLLAMLWMESDTARARNALNQSLHSLRRDLGSDLVIEGSFSLRLNPNIISVDADEFSAAIQGADWRRAVELYRGPFLAGVFVTGAPAFEQWVDQERRRWAAEYAAATERLASAAAASGDHLEAVAQWRRLAGFEPHNARVAAKLARAQRAAGDRAGALNSIHEFGERLRADLALSLDSELIELADAIRAELRARRSSPRLGADAELAGTSPGTEQAVAPAPARSGWRPRYLALVLLGTGTLALVATLWSLLSREGGSTSAGEATSIVVLPFIVHGDSSSGYLQDGMARLVAHGLDGTRSLRAAVYPGSEELVGDAHSTPDSARLLSRRLHLDRYITGDVTLLAAGISVRAALHDAGRQGQVLGVAVAKGAVDSVFAVADAITRQLLGLEAMGSAGGLVRAASVNTASLAAFRAFMEGEAFFRVSRFADAVTSFQRAIREDSTFALAYYRLSVALDWNAQAALIPAATAGAMRFADRLPWRERTLLEGSVAWREGRNDEAEAKFQSITSRYPNDAEAWFQHGEVLFHSNGIRARSLLEARLPFERVVALEPTNRGALTHLARIHAYLGDPGRTDSLVRAAGTLMASGLDAELELFRAVVIRDARARQAALARLETEPPSTLITAVGRLAAYARDLQAADTVVQRAVRAGLSAANREPVRYWATQLAAAQGQSARVLVETATIGETDPWGALEIRALIMTLPVHAFGKEARAATLREIEAAAVSGSKERELTTRQGLGKLVRWYLLGSFAARAEDPVRLRSYADSLLDAAKVSGQSRDASALAAGLRSWYLALTGHPIEALAELSSAPEPTEPGKLILTKLNERFLRARLLQSLGRNEEAMGVLGSLVYGDVNSVMLAAPAGLSRARLLTRLNRPSEARRDYEGFLAAFEHADAPLQPLVDSARQELARLSGQVRR